MGSTILNERIARCRLIGSLFVLAAVLIDPLQPVVNLWGHISSPMEPDLFAAAAVHSAYSVAVYLMVRNWVSLRVRIGTISTWADVLFAGVFAFVTEGRIVVFGPFFTFAILEAGLQAGMRSALSVAAASILVWLALVALLIPENLLISFGRAVYLLIVGYLVGYLGQQRSRLESEIRLRDIAEQRARIARDLHDGYLQVLGAANLSLEACRALLRTGNHQAVENDLDQLQSALNREHDQVREYLRSLAEVDMRLRTDDVALDTWFSLQVNVEGSAALLDHLLNILREALTNIRRHSAAHSASIVVTSAGKELNIAIDDDGRGFGDAELPWSIASRVHELGGGLSMVPDSGPGAHLLISLPRE
jgi:signal transduction histidine kinase